MVDVASRSTVSLQTSIKEIVSSGLRALVRSDKNFYETMGKCGQLLLECSQGQTTLLQLFGAKTHHISDDTGIEPTNESEYVITSSQKRAGRWACMNFKIVLSYHGGSFDGWQKQPDLNIVQELIEKSLGKFVDERKAGLLRDKGL
ncbi:hypothetical protein L2E82_30776 [Cichorium intybus]|uniref:Uncharacterized protein n=1 Tax=Cichorium intybus TaxID=13427 RepID=A0ACB9D159_CICIN|nr:hypothetical protein L2E82_30776 [Cichorium intybus]